MNVSLGKSSRKNLPKTLIPLEVVPLYQVRFVLGPPNFGPGDHVRLLQRSDPAYVRKHCEASLKNLGVDYIDLYYQNMMVKDGRKERRRHMEDRGRASERKQDQVSWFERGRRGVYQTGQQSGQDRCSANRGQYKFPALIPTY